ncbi:UNVERIFIED_ORG: Na+-transporting methylmalonyl-CoA/oxaloacetate decarboxylase gamma subunit [Peribacillus simplex]
MNLVVILGIISLFFVGGLWIWVYSYIKNTVTLSAQEDKIILVTVGVGCFILFLFILILVGLINHKHLNKFPAPEAFYDVNQNKHTQTNTFAFIFISARLRIFDEHYPDKYELGLDFKFPWKGHKLYYISNKGYIFSPEEYSKFDQELTIDKFVAPPEKSSPIYITDSKGDEKKITTF